MEHPIYLDHAATTPVAAEVLSAMLPYFAHYYGNASAIHSLGAASRDAVEEAREAVAGTINALPDEIVFTSGGTESDNAALRGAAEANSGKGRHLLCTAIEHHAVLEPLEALVHRQGYSLDLIPVDWEGRVNPAVVAEMIRPDTVLVSVMHANNEIGTIQPIAEIGAICRDRKIVFHTDAVQTAGKIPIDVRAMLVDILSLSAHKFYGPKGAGALYVRRGVRLDRYQDGGEQERGRRGGTLNVPGIVGLGKAIELTAAEMTEEGVRQNVLREQLISGILSQIDGIRVTGGREHRLPSNVHVCVEGVQGEAVLLALDSAGICASAGSACTAGSADPSHVLKALGIDRDLARGALRLTLGKSTCAAAVKFTIETLAKTIKNLRRLATS